MSDRDAPFESSFMDDYFAEADEHILAVRRCLLGLERSLGAQTSPAVLEELFRSFHSLKGISAMVELHEAESLAHVMESGLRAIRQGEIELDAANFERLLTGANALEGVILARRRGEAMPSVEPVLADLQALASARPDATTPVARSGKTPSGSRVWTVRFVPSPTLIERGVKVDTIRTRLLQIGNVLTVAPQVLSSGSICFEFEVQTEDEASLASWSADGVSYEPSTATHAGDEVPADEASPSAQRAWELSAGSPTNFVRVDLTRLDDLMRLVGELVVSRSRLEDTLRRAERQMPPREFRALQEHDSGMARQLRDLREAIMRVRLVPVGEVFRRMPFVVRDLSRDENKQVSLEIVGQGTEIDKFLIERMMDPVLHLVRNAIGHGIETPQRRVAAGKPAAGTIRLSASTSGPSVIIEIADDGAGIDVDAVAQRARDRGIHTGDGPLDPHVLLDIICASGFSTRDEADRVSGRGVGMAVVRGAIQELGGTLGVETTPGQGTTFTIALPLTLAITDAMIVNVGDHTFAVPQSSVQEVIEVNVADLRSIERNEIITHRGRGLPMLRLERVFRIVGAHRSRHHAIVVGTGLGAVGILVDRIAGHREIVVKSITDPLIRVDGVSGATELGDGRLVLILDVAALSRSWRGRLRAGDRMLA